METATGNVPSNEESASVACRCGPQCDDTRPKDGHRTLPIVWQRLVADGATCPRCESTGTEVEQAVATLADVLRPLGIEPTLNIRSIAQAEFDAARGRVEQDLHRRPAVGGMDRRDSRSKSLLLGLWQQRLSDR